MHKLKKGKVSKALSLGLIGILSMGLIMSNTSLTSSAHNTYFLGITIDQSSGNFKYVPTVVYEENGNMSADNHREAQIGDFSPVVSGTKYKDFDLPYVEDASSDPDKAKEAYKGFVDDGNGDKGLQFTFPGLHGRDAFVPKVNANGLDQDVANFMAENLVGDLNQSISFVVNNSSIRTAKSYSADKYKRMVIDLANSAQKAYSSGSSSFSVDGTTFSVTRGTDANSKAIDETYCEPKDYVVIKAPNGTIISSLYHANKGYQTNRDDISKKYKDSMKGDSEKKWRVSDELNWKMIILQGNYLSDVKQITFASVNEIVKPSDVALVIGEFFGGMLSGLRNLLGLYPLNDIFLNTGGRNTGYYYGLMPKTWMTSAMLLHVVCQTIAWSVMGFAIIKILLKRQLQTMNIGERVSLMEGLKDLIVTGFTLGAFALIFNILARTNYALVGLFASSTSFSEQIGQTTTMSTGLFATIIINFAFFVITAYFNFMYVLRAFTLALLYGIAPIAIVCISFGGKYKQIFSTYTKELIANIFLQSFHAVCVSLFTNITSTTQLRTFELFGVLVAFIPLTKMLRQSILGLPGGITDEAKSATNMAVGGATAIAGGIAGGIGSRFGGSNSSSSNNSSSYGGNGNKGIVNNRIQDAINSKAPVKEEKANMLSKGANYLKNSVTGSTAEARNKTTSNKDLMGAMNSENNLSGVNTANNSKVLAKNGGFGSSKSPLSVKSLGASAYRQMGGASGIAKGIAKASMAVGQVGLAVGGGAIGDSNISSTMLKNASRNISGATSYGNESTEGSNSFNDTADSHGGKELYNSGESSTIVYDTDESGTFNNPDLADSDYGQNFKEMYQAFSGTGDYAQGNSKASYRKDAVNYYKSQGYQGIGYYNKGEGMAVKINKDVMQKKGYDFRANPIPYNPTKFKSGENSNKSNKNDNNRPDSPSEKKSDTYTKTDSGIFIKG